MKCRECNAELPHGAHRCRHCGRPILHEKIWNNKRLRALFIGIIIVLVAVGAGFAVVASQDAAVNRSVKDAICNFQFDTAETRRRDVKLFPAGDNDLCESLQQLALASDMTNAQAAQKLLDLIGFSDTNQLLMSNGSYAQVFLTGSWSSDAGELTVSDAGVTCSLPGLGEKDCTIRGNAIYDSADEGAAAFYRFSVLNSRMMIADAVGDGRAYTMFRQ